AATASFVPTYPVRSFEIPATLNIALNNILLESLSALISSDFCSYSRIAAPSSAYIRRSSQVHQRDVSEINSKAMFCHNMLSCLELRLKHEYRSSKS
ncbi:MAG TPA: hypothetical protein VIJ25_09210, partial [Methylococcales bacterium]